MKRISKGLTSLATIVTLASGCDDSERINSGQIVGKLCESEREYSVDL